MEDISPHPSASSSRRRYLSRSSRLVVIGGLAAGASFAAVTGISAAAGTGTTTTPTASSGPAPAVAPMPGRWGPGRNGGPRGRARSGPDGGTITALSGRTLTLRTENGTETVDTSASTAFKKERQAITFSALQIDDVVHVVGTPASTGSSTATPPQPGTGTVNATSITVVEPRFAGRVESISGGTYTLVGRDGQVLTVTTSGSTRYYAGRSETSSTAISVGNHVVAQGPRSSLTQLSADLIAVEPARASRPAPPSGTATPPPAPPSGQAPPSNG